jgi:hypothetical protein
MPRRRKTAPPSYDDLASARTFIVAHSSLSPHRLKLERLSPADQAELVSIWREAWREEGGFNLGDPKQRARYEAIVEKLGGLEPGTYRRLREEDEMKSKMAALQRRLNRISLPGQTPEQEKRLLRVLHQHMAKGYMQIEHLAGLMVILAIFQVGDGLGRGQEVIIDDDTGEAVLKLDNTKGSLLGGICGEHTVGPERWMLDHLVTNQWITLRRPPGPIQEIRLGARSRELLGLPKLAKPKPQPVEVAS